MSLTTAAELRARIESKRRTDYLASLAKTAARQAEVEATAYLRLTSMKSMLVSSLVVRA